MDIEVIKKPRIIYEIPNYFEAGGYNMNTFQMKLKGNLIGIGDFNSVKEFVDDVLPLKSDLDLQGLNLDDLSVEMLNARGTAVNLYCYSYAKGAFVASNYTSEVNKAFAKSIAEIDFIRITKRSFDFDVFIRDKESLLSLVIENGTIIPIEYIDIVDSALSELNSELKGEFLLA